MLTAARNDLTRTKSAYLKTAVNEAQTNALKQIKDYLSLFGYDVTETAFTNVARANMTISNTEITNGNVDLDSLKLSASDQNSFTNEYTSQIAKLKAAISTDDVEESLNDVLKVIDKYLANLTSAEVTDAERTALVNEIISFADSKKVSTATNSAGISYSSTIVNKYDAMVEEAVAAAKAVQTKAEYYEVINKYLGTVYSSTVSYTHLDVYKRQPSRVETNAVNVAVLCDRPFNPLTLTG